MASAAGGSGTGGGDRCGMYVSWNKMCMCCGIYVCVVECIVWYLLCI